MSTHARSNREDVVLPAVLRGAPEAARAWP